MLTARRIVELIRDGKRNGRFYRAIQVLPCSHSHDIDKQLCRSRQQALWLRLKWVTVSRLLKLQNILRFLIAVLENFFGLRGEAAF